MKKILVLFLILINGMHPIKAQVDFVWGKQFGAVEDDKARNLVTDKFGNIYIFGKTKGKIGDKRFGKEDGFIAKLDSTARLIWKIQIGTVEHDDLLNGVTDEVGNLYITGYAGIISDNVLNRDILVAKIDRDGKSIWQKQFGTESDDIGTGIAVLNDSDIYVIGETEGIMADSSYGKKDCFILHLNDEGNQLDILQFGTPAMDGLYGIMIDNNSKLYVCGSTGGDLVKPNAGKLDIFWGIFSKNLKTIKMEQYGTEEDDFPGCIKTENNAIYIAGSTRGDLGEKQAGEGDSFVQKLNENGEIIWTKQFGTDRWDGVNGLDIIQDNKIIVSGCLHYPNCRSFCRMYDAGGALLWSSNHVIQGTGGGTCGKGICIDSRGNIYHAGYTGANMFSELEGEHDIFIVKFKLDRKNNK